MRAPAREGTVDESEDRAGAKRPRGRPRKVTRTPLGEALKAARLAAGYNTLKEAAARAGVSDASWSRYETIVRGSYWPTITKLIDRCDLPLEYFFRRDQILRAAARLTRAREKTPGGRDTPRGRSPESETILPGTPGESTTGATDADLTP